MLCFSRDTEVLSVFNHSAGNPVHAVLKNKPATVENTVAFPPSGVIPFHGFTMYGKFLYLSSELLSDFNLCMWHDSWKLE